ncbi:MAG: MlaE family lipid ABC transporter permease subunit [Desulfobaccales bacterium]
MPVSSPETHAFTLSVSGEPEGEITLQVQGRLTLDNLTAFLSALEAETARVRPQHLRLDLERLEYLDTAATLMLHRRAAEYRERGTPCEFVRLSPEAQRMFALLSWEEFLAAPPPAPKKRSWLLERLGDWTLAFVADVAELITFTGGLILELLTVPFRPHRVRWADVITAMKRVGVDGLPIITLLSFLLGLIVAFLSAMQLKQFGANIYVADLTAIAMVQELGPIMTGVMVAGRSGSSFAAEIGTMKVNEEVDALATMGFDPVRFLAVPKVLACLVVLPLLTYYADLFGILGGMVVGAISLDLTIYTFLKEVQWSITHFDILYGTAKSLVFAVLIAGIGCQRGFQVRGGAEAVGTATTSAVVASIFMIIVVDSAFAVARQFLRPYTLV